jgi:DNA polymerase III delta prime subunit
MSKNRLLTEVLRPKKIDQLILPDRIRAILGDGTLKQNYLFYGGPGLGKTSAAKVLAANYPYIYINCSDETGVDTVREKINKWCSTISVMDGAEAIKVVILDELDGVSDQFFKALRGTIEKFADQARFIGTCNYFNKIPDAMHSRFTLVNFDFLDPEEEEKVYQEQVKRASTVLNKLNIAHNQDAVEELVKRCLPDMRKLFNRIQTMQISGVTELTRDSIMKTEWSFEDIFKLCAGTPDPYNNYIFLINQYGSRVDDVLGALGDEFPKWLAEKHPSKVNLLPGIIVEVAVHQAQRVHVIDPAISMTACIFKIQTILNSIK